MDTPIQSPANPLIKRLRRLHHGTGRRKQNRFLIEGRRAIAAALDADWQPETCFVREDLVPPAGWEPIRLLSEAAVRRLSQAVEPSGYLALFPIPQPPTLIPQAGGLCCWSLRDPGNLGTLIRSAAACACPQIVLVDCCDPWSAKVVQASAGTVARVNIHCLSAVEGHTVLEGLPDSVALVVRDGETSDRMPIGNTWLVVGGEAEGLPEDTAATCRHRLTLSMATGVESLNAAVAASIALYMRMERLARPRTSVGDASSPAPRLLLSHPDPKDNSCNGTGE